MPDPGRRRRRNKRSRPRRVLRWLIRQHLLVPLVIFAVAMLVIWLAAYGRLWQLRYDRCRFDPTFAKPPGSQIDCASEATVSTILLLALATIAAMSICILLSRFQLLAVNPDKHLGDAATQPIFLQDWLERWIGRRRLDVLYTLRWPLITTLLTLALGALFLASFVAG